MSEHLASVLWSSCLPLVVYATFGVHPPRPLAFPPNYRGPFPPHMLPPGQYFRPLPPPPGLGPTFQQQPFFPPGVPPQMMKNRHKYNAAVRASIELRLQRGLERSVGQGMVGVQGPTGFNGPEPVVNPQSGLAAASNQGGFNGAQIRDPRGSRSGYFQDISQMLPGQGIQNRPMRRQNVPRQSFVARPEARASAPIYMTGNNMAGSVAQQNAPPTFDGRNVIREFSRGNRVTRQNIDRRNGASRRLPGRQRLNRMRNSLERRHNINVIDISAASNSPQVRTNTITNTQRRRQTEAVIDLTRVQGNPVRDAGDRLAGNVIDLRRPAYRFPTGGVALSNNMEPSAPGASRTAAREAATMSGPAMRPPDTIRVVEMAPERSTGRGSSPQIQVVSSGTGRSLGAGSGGVNVLSTAPGSTGIVDTGTVQNMPSLVSAAAEASSASALDHAHSKMTEPNTGSSGSRLSPDMASQLKGALMGGIVDLGSLVQTGTPGSGGGNSAVGLSGDVVTVLGEEAANALLGALGGRMGSATNAGNAAGHLPADMLTIDSAALERALQKATAGAHPRPAPGARPQSSGLAASAVMSANSVKTQDQNVGELQVIVLDSADLSNIKVNGVRLNKLTRDQFDRPQQTAPHIAPARNMIGPGPDSQGPVLPGLDSQVGTVGSPVGAIAVGTARQDTIGLFSVPVGDFPNVPKSVSAIPAGVSSMLEQSSRDSRPHRHAA